MYETHVKKRLTSVIISYETFSYGTYEFLIALYSNVVFNRLFLSSLKTFLFIDTRLLIRTRIAALVFMIAGVPVPVQFGGLARC